MSNYLVIGGSSGIGKTLTEELAQAGHQVYASYNTHPASSSGNINYFQLDVLSDYMNFDSIPDQIDGLVYCPGSINLLPFHRIKPADFTNDYELQVVGAIKVLQNTMDRLKKSEGISSVVFLSTVAVQSGFNFHSQVSASKGAIEGLTRALAAEWAPKIRVNAVAPSLTDTPLAGKLLSNDQKKEANAERHPMKRVGSSHDISSIVSFLLSDQSSWITGQVLPVDGGMSVIRS